MAEIRFAPMPRIELIGADRWRIDVSVVKSGIQYRERRTITGSKRQATTAYWELRAEIKEKAKRGELDRDRERHQFAFILSQYRRDRERVGRLRSMAPIIDRLDRDCGTYDMDQFDRRFATYLDTINAETSTRTGRSLSAATKNRIIAVARAACIWAYRHGMIDRQPLRMVQMHRETPRDRVLRPDEVQCIRNVLPIVVRQHCAPWLPAAFEFSMKNPIRASDLRELRRDSWDRINGLIRYTSGKTATQTTAIEYPEWSQMLPANRSPWIFAEAWGLQISRDRIGDVWQAVRDAAGLTDVRWHDLRHHAATWLYSQGVPAHEVQRIGGWRRREMVERYHHLDADEAATSARRRLQGVTASVTILPPTTANFNRRDGAG